MHTRDRLFLWRLLPLLLAAALFAAAVATTSCAMLADTLSAPEALDANAMTDAEWQAWRDRNVERVGIIADGLYQDGTLAGTDLDKAASWLAVMATGNPLEVGALAGALEVTGLELALLKLGLLELDGKLVDSGLYGADGFLNERGKELLIHLSVRLEAIHTEP